jgi:hypothetical protein
MLMPILLRRARTRENATCTPCKRKLRVAWGWVKPVSVVNGGAGALWLIALEPIALGATALGLSALGVSGVAARRGTRAGSFGGTVFAGGAVPSDSNKSRV